MYAKSARHAASAALGVAQCCSVLQYVTAREVQCTMCVT